MRVLAGLEYGGATLTEFDALELGCGVIGHGVWGPGQLLRDLELRLGAGGESVSEAVRVAHWAVRIAELAPQGRFYTKSFEADALGTARTLLRLRDSLVEAGWDGQAIADSGARVEAIVELECLRDPAQPDGYADRLARVELSLKSQRQRIYAEIIVAEPLALWSSRWQRIFMALAERGTTIEHREPDLGGAAADSDLGRVQAALQSNEQLEAGPLQGDGSFVLLTAETSWEAAHATAAILAELPPGQTVVMRQADVSALDNALSTHGARTQGWRSTSPWRATLQVLPLALELAFEPKDPQRVLELLTLPVGPFRGLAGRRLAMALTTSPGIGSPAWEEAKATLTNNCGADVLARISDWLEQTGDDAIVGTPKAPLLSVVERVRTWLISRIPSAPEDATLLTAVRHAGALRAALEGDPRSSFSLVEVRRLAESVVETGTVAQLIDERAGRTPHIDSASGLRISRENVIWWSFIDAHSAGVTPAWRRHELTALSAAGIVFPDPKSQLEQRAIGWRQAVLAARKRILLVAPKRCAGSSFALHPLWDEIVARTGANEATLARVTTTAQGLREPASIAGLLETPKLVKVEAAPLTGGRQEWVVPSEAIAASASYSASSLNVLLGCPLQWGLRYRAGVNAGGHALPPLHRLNGTLGHRLIELLFAQGAFDLARDALRLFAEGQLDQLFEREGAILLRSGMAFERSQLRRQLLDSVLELSRALTAAGLRILAVEKPIEVSWRGVKLMGRIDLLVGTETGAQAIIDVKWGLSSYRDLLRSGHALQLAVYAFAHAAERGEQQLPDANYFSLKQRKLFGLASELLPNAETIDGPSLTDTWNRIERSVEQAERVTSSGRFAVTGVRRSLPLLTSLGVAHGSHAVHFALEPELSCTYCGFDAICGRRWEVWA